LPKPVIFVPGFPGSELRDGAGRVVFPPSPGTLLDASRKAAFIAAVTNVPGTLKAGPPIRSVLNIAKEAQSLYDLLNRRGYDAGSSPSNNFHAVGWDWRLGVDDPVTMTAIANAITGFGGAKVVAIIHSAGALVFRAFLAAHPELVSSIEQVLAFGGAWAGTLDALHAIHVGVAESFLGLSFLSADEGAEIVGHAQAAYDLLPPDPAQSPMDDVQLVHDMTGAQASATINQSWIKPGRTYAPPLATHAQRLAKRNRDFGPLPMTNVVGWGGATWPSCILEPGNVIFAPPDKDAGDDTVPRVSAGWIRGANTRTITIPIGAFAADPIPEYHAHLWDSLAVAQIFDEVLGGHARSPLVAAAADADEAIDFDKPVTIRLVAQDESGNPLPGAVAFANVNGSRIAIPFHGGIRAILKLSRAGLHHNAATDVYRFTVDFQWTGGSRKGFVVSIKSP
jgi:hypothetical protein